MSAGSIAEVRVPATVALELYPGFNRFALDLVRGTGSARELLPRGDSFPLPSLPKKKPDPALVEELRRSNAAWGNDVGAELEAWSRGETATLIAGQQVGFAGGPLYTLAKAASLVAIARDLRSRGVESTLFFWMATEDHDFEEVATLEIESGDEVKVLEASRPPKVPSPVGLLPLPPDLVEALRRELSLGDEPWLEPGITFRDSFARLFSSVFRDHRIVLVDSLLPSLRRAAAPLVSSVVDRWSELQATVRERSEAVKESGYQPQVAAAEDGSYSMLFLLRDGARLPLRRNDEWTVEGKAIDERELARIVAETPERISTAALVRPVVQDALFGTDVFVGGPAEVSYYAQTAGLHRALGVRLPHVALRGHAIVAPARILEFIDRYAIDPSELFSGADDVVLRRERDLGAELDRLLANLSSDLERDISEIATLVTTADRGLQKSIERTMRHLRYHVGKLGERGRKAIARSDVVRFRQIERVARTFAPGGAPQDRHIGWITFWLQHGPRLVERLVAEIEPDSDKLRIVSL